jgi:peptidoglycan/LPS O-acetylase OafA/YrhL
MFFVLSGFLITNQLLSEYRQNGRISLGAFYARRIKRIFPASLLVILATGITWALLFGPGLANEILRSLAAAAASLSNFYFKASSLDYFQADSGSSPVLHYWSLAVEEQFYLAYPVLLLLIARITRWRNSADSFPRLVGLTLTVATVLSFLAMTFSSPTAAFYLPWFRAWELSAGGLIAVFVASQGEAARRIAPHVRSALLAMGSVGLITAFVYSETFTRWPGYETAIPVVAT